jgi:hypothetical protein
MIEDGIMDNGSNKKNAIGDEEVAFTNLSQ